MSYIHFYIRSEAFVRPSWMVVPCCFRGRALGQGQDEPPWVATDKVLHWVAWKGLRHVPVRPFGIHRWSDFRSAA